VKSAANKDFIREIRNNLGRFLSIFFIVLLGVAFFAGLSASAPIMEYSMDQYFDEYNILDIQVLSTLGMTDEDMQAIGEIPGVKQVQAGKFNDATSFIGTTEIVYRIHSLPEGYSQDSAGNYVNQVQVIEGRLPQTSGEIVIEESMSMPSGLTIGDYITFKSGTNTPITEDALATDRFLVVGKVQTPYYLTYEKGSSTISSGTVNLFAYILESDFIYDYHIEALVTVAGAKELNAFDKDYQEKINDIKEQIEAISGERCEIRVNEVRDDAEKALADAKKQYEEGKATFEEEIAKAEKELADAYDELIAGETTLEVEKKNFEETYNSSLQQIKDSEAQIRDMEAMIKPMINGYENIEGYINDFQGETDNFVNEWNSNISDAQKELDEINDQINSGNYTGEELERLENLKGYYENYIDTASKAGGYVTDIENNMDGFIDGVDDAVGDIKSSISSAKKQLADAKAQLEAGKLAAEQKFAEAEQKLAEGWLAYEEGMAELAKNKAEGQKQLDDAYEQLVLAENEIAKIENAQWHVLDRQANVGFVDYSMTTERVASIASIFPVFFFLVAALVCSTNMTRMVDEQRGIIGTYKALGYNNLAIAKKYVLYAGTASAAGGFIGVFLGVIFFPYAVYYAWSAMYTLPPIRFEWQILLMIISFIMGIAVSVATAYFTCQRDLKETPASMMRPKAPKAGKTILLERVTFLWKALSFSQKVTARNIFRYKKRFWMTVIGIAGCAALLLAGFGLSNSVSEITNRQFKEIFKYDLSLDFASETTDEQREEIFTLLEEEEHVASYINSAMVMSTARKDDESLSFSMIVPADPASMSEYICLRDRASQDEFQLPETGIVVTEKFAKELGLGIGDTVEITNNLEITREVEVTGITENYIFHYAYMNPDAYESIFRLPAENNSLLVKLDQQSEELDNQLSSLFISYPQIGSVKFYSSMADQLDDQISSINYIVVIIIVCAALLAIIVLYNLTNINISERTREIATLKVLGFTDKEVYMYVYRENFILTGIGGALGLVGGVFLHRIIMDAIEQDDIMFGYHLETLSFFIVFLMTVIFSVIVSLSMNKRLDDIDMVESLKSIE